MDIQEDLINALKQNGLRITPQRIAICKLLAHSDEHPTAESIYESLKDDYPSLSVATVYNTLDVLVAFGKVNVLGDAGDGKSHFDANGEPHVHLACVKCHSITDIASNLIPSLSNEVLRSSGFKISGYRIMYYGICPACQEKT